jgi:hypothetical protein
MRLVSGPIPEDEGFHPLESGWNALREPAPEELARPAGWAGLAALAAALALVDFQGLDVGLLTPAAVILGALALIPVHEIIHALFMPRPRPGEEILLGWWRERWIFYAFFTGEQSRERLLTVLLAPLCLLSLLPLVLLRVAGVPASTLSLILVAHAFLCGGDLVAGWLVARQVPARARVRNQGWLSYWKTT